MNVCFDRHLIRRVLHTVLGALMSFAAVAAQDPSPLPTPADRSPAVKISTTLIQIDVTVKDKGGRTLTDLKPDEIEIFENGVKQKVTAFSYIANSQAAEKDRRKHSAGIEVPEPPLILRPEQVRRTIALVVDDLTLSFESASHTRDALRRFVDLQMQDGDLVGIVRTGAGIGALQQFTSDKNQLFAAIDRVRWNPKGIGRFGSFDPIEPTGTELARQMGDPETSAEDIRVERDFLKGSVDFRESIFASGTLGALRYIVDGMGELPGRKSVILFSDGLKVFNNTESGSLSASRILEFLRQLVGEANKKAVIFYPLDARGLQYTGFTAADKLFDPRTQNDPSQVSLEQRLSERNSELFDSQQGLQYLAKETGGFAYVNRNDLSAGVQKVLEDQSYYLVAYEPQEESFNAAERRYNRLDVKVTRPGVEVRHRTGFFVGEAERRLLVDINVPTKIMRALTSPFAVNDIPLKLNALFGHAANRGYFVHSFLHIDASRLEFKPLANGNVQASFDILAVSYGENGAPVDKENLIGTIVVKRSELERVKEQGIAYSFIFPVKQPGAYQMRVAVLDKATREVGSANQFIEVPDLKKEGITLSGIVVENISDALWKRQSSGTESSKAMLSDDEIPDPKYSTANRKFKRGSVLRFGVEIYNAKAASVTASQIKMLTRVFHDRQLVFQSAETVLDANAKPPSHTDSIALGTNLAPGDYVMQIVVIDGMAKSKRRLATQYIQFEVID